MSDVDGLEQVSVLSVGIDIGTSTSQVVFSRLVARRRGADLSAEFELAQRDLVSAAPVILTPYRDSATIDIDELTGYLEESFQRAGVRPEDVDTGVLVITGEALNRANAEALAGHLARATGRFVCVSAGPQHEALLAAHGSGAVALSAADGSTVLNIDIGGGTTKLTVISSGQVVRTAALTIGARLVAVDPDGRMTRIEPAAHLLAELLDLRLRLGEPLPAGARGRLVDLMASLILEAAAGGCSGRLAVVLLTDPIPPELGVAGADAVMISGGVAEYLFDPDPVGHGDLGLDLAARIRTEIDTAGLTGRLRRATQAGRATVLGAGEYSLAPSGITGYLTEPAALPVHGLQVVKVTIEPETDAARAVWSALHRLDRDEYGPGLVFALTFPTAPGYQLLRRAAEAIRAAARGPLYVVTDADRGRALGRLLHHELGYPDPIVSIDGIRVGDLDFLDIGTPLGNSAAVPVTIKSLVFPAHDIRYDTVRS